MKKLFYAAAFIAGLALLQGCSDTVAQSPTPHHFTVVPADEMALEFTIYCGQASGAYTQNVNIPSDSTNRANPVSIDVIDVHLPDGGNYCAATARNFRGESGYTPEIFVTIQDGDLLTGPPSTPSQLTVD
ncbi:MAG: hypothetical protein PVI43_00150 [Candidatus Bathyarchaeota archaeon]|jgi:hypothetical protein